MKFLTSITGTALPVLVGFFLNGAFAPAADPAPDQTADAQGMTVEARGPIHEAFAQPDYAASDPGLVVPKQPPAPIPEEPPDQKPEGNVMWIPGYWAWDNDRNDFLWVSGFWRTPPPGRRWVPGTWNQVNDGWQWTPGFWASENQTETPYLSAPPATLDNGPNVPAPDDDSNYVPGLWVYRNSGFVWRPGYWLGCRPGWLWNPAHYCWTPRGNIFCDGYWDYPLESRGLPFAPVSFAAPLWNDPAWVYRPDCALNLPSVLSSLFIRPNYCHYYFGDFYGARYAGLGFRSWVGEGGRFYDPLYGHYRWANRNNPAWFRDLRALDAGRRNGTFERPAHTLAQQNALLRNNVHNERNVNNMFVNNRNQYLRSVTPLGELGRGGRGLTGVTAAEREQHLANTRNFADLRQHRTEVQRGGEAGRQERPGNRDATTLGRLNLAGGGTQRAAGGSHAQPFQPRGTPGVGREPNGPHTGAVGPHPGATPHVPAPHVNARPTQPAPPQRAYQAARPQPAYHPAPVSHVAHTNPAPRPPAYHPAPRPPARSPAPRPAPRPPAHSPAPRPPAHHR